MLYFLLHLCVLLVQLLSISLPRHDVLLHLLDLVVQHKFEFLQLLCLAPQVADAFAFLVESSVAFSYFFSL